MAFPKKSDIKVRTLPFQKTETGNPEDGDFAMIAYIDYNKVYIREWNSPAALYTFEESKKAVDFYIDKLTKIKAAGMAEETTEQEPFSDVKYLSDNIYAECEG